MQYSFHTVVLPTSSITFDKDGNPYRVDSIVVDGEFRGYHVGPIKE